MHFEYGLKYDVIGRDDGRGVGEKTIIYRSISIVFMITSFLGSLDNGQFQKDES